MKLCPIYAAVVVALSSMPVLAQEESEEETVVVTATQMLVANAVDDKTLEQKQASDVKDILNGLPSVTVDGNARYSRKVYARGLEDKFSAVTIDGARQEGQMFHHSGDQTIDAELVKIAEVDLGPNSALSGAGVINAAFKYETKDPSDLLEEGENFGGKIKLNSQSAYERKGANLSLFGRINETNELLMVTNYQEDGSLYIPDSESVDSKSSTLKSGLVKWVSRPTDNQELELSLSHYNDGGKRQITGEKAGDDATDNTYNALKRDTVTLNHNLLGNRGLLDLSTTVYYNRQYMALDGSNSAQRDGSGVVAVPERTYEVVTQGAEIRNVSLLGDHQLTYGIDGYHSYQDLSADGEGVYISGANLGQTVDYSVDGGQITALGLYFEDAVTLHNLEVKAGFRYDLHKLGGPYSGTDQQLSPKLQLAYTLTDDITLRSSYGRIFKGVSLPETFMMTTADNIDQGDTEAMTGDNYEVGFDLALSSLFTQARSNFGFTAYQYNVDNYLHPTKSNSELESSSDVEIWGVESVFNYQLDTLRFYLSHSYSMGESYDKDNNVTSQLRETDIHNIKLGLSYEVNENLTLGWDGRFVPGNEHTSKGYRRGTYSESEVRRDGFSVHNIWANYNVAAVPGLDVSLGIDNVFNKKYAEHTSFLLNDNGDNSIVSFEPGFNAKLSVGYLF